MPPVTLIPVIVGCIVASALTLILCFLDFDASDKIECDEYDEWTIQ
jgi:hypothetical protein